MSPHRRGPRPLAVALASVQAELAPDTLLGEVQQRWVELVGEAIASEAQPVAERGGVLTVSCAAAVWAQELDLMAPMILGRCNAVLRRGTLTRMRCVTVPPSDLMRR
jgi:predicted nucleic acid-binding Zn ribbon protein